MTRHRQLALARKQPKPASWEEKPYKPAMSLAAYMELQDRRRASGVDFFEPERTKTEWEVMWIINDLSQVPDSWHKRPYTASQRNDNARRVWLEGCKLCGWNNDPETAWHAMAIIRQRCGLATVDANDSRFDLQKVA